jgi:hypothetical protein
MTVTNIGFVLLNTIIVLFLFIFFFSF